MSNKNKFKIKVSILNRKTGKFSIQSQSLEKLILGGNQPVSQLTSEQLTRIKRIYSFLNYLFNDTFENWVRTFTLDVFPEREIRLWEIITFVFVKYTEQHILNFKQKKDVMLRLIILSSGEKPKDKLSQELFLFREQLLKEIQGETSQNTNLETEGADKALEDVSPWDRIDFVKLAFVYQKYINQHEFSSEEEDDIFVRLQHLMAGEEPKDDLSRELLHALENEFDPQNLTDDRERVVSLVVQRKGQSKFRRELLKVYKEKCAITSFMAEKRLLEAAHIIPYLGNETNHPSNGILLRVDIHRLFDKHLLSIHPKSYEVVISPSLCGTDYEGLGGKKLLLPEKDRFKPNSIALEQHYQAFLQKSEKKKLPPNAHGSLPEE